MYLFSLFPFSLLQDTPKYFEALASHQQTIEFSKKPRTLHDTHTSVYIFKLSCIYNFCLFGCYQEVKNTRIKSLEDYFYLRLFQGYLFPNICLVLLNSLEDIQPLR